MSPPPVLMLAAGRGALSWPYNVHACPPDDSFISTVLHPDSVVGYTHASSVIPFVRSRPGASLTVTMSFVPSNVNAEPKRPDVVQTAPDTVPAWALPEESARVVPDPSLNPHAPIAPVGVDELAVENVHV